MKRSFFLVMLLAFMGMLNAQQNVFRKDTFVVGHLIDTAIKKGNLYTEISFGLPGGAFSRTQGGIAGRNYALTLETNFRVGYFPIKRLLVGWTITPYITFSNLGVEGFRWSTGPFVRYYLPFYRVNRFRELKSPFALYFFFEARFGQYNPVILDAPYDTRVVGGFAGGIGFDFKLKKNLKLNIQFGPAYDLFSPGYSGNLNFLFSVGLNYSFPTKHDRQKTKLDKLKSN